MKLNGKKLYLATIFLGLGFLFAQSSFGQKEYHNIRQAEFAKYAQIEQSFWQLRFANDDISAQIIADNLYSLLAISPKSSINALMAIAGDYEAKEKLPQALETYEKIIKIDGEYSIAYINAASLLFQFNERQKALNYLKRAIKIEPRNYSAWEGMGIVLEQMGDLKGAQYAYEKALFIHPFLENSKRGIAKIKAQTEGIIM